MPRSTRVRLRELHLVVLHDLDAVAPRIVEVEASAARYVDARLEQRAARLLLVVDDEAEVPRAVRLLRAALHQRNELVAHVDERHPSPAASQLELEESSVELERLVDVADLERDVVDADESGQSAPGSSRKSAPACSGGAP